MADQVAHYVRENGGEFARNLDQVVKQNPVPMLLVGVGLAWMMLGSRRDAGCRGRPICSTMMTISVTAPTTPPDAIRGEVRAWGGAESDDDEGRASAAVRRAREGLSEASDRQAKAGLERGGRPGPAGVEQAADATHGARRAWVGSLGAPGRAPRASHSVHAAPALKPVTTVRAPAPAGSTRCRSTRWCWAPSAAIGAAIAAALPPSRREDELLGDTSDDLRRRAWAAGREGCRPGQVGRRRRLCRGRARGARAGAERGRRRIGRGNGPPQSRDRRSPLPRRPSRRPASGSRSQPPTRTQADMGRPASRTEGTASPRGKPPSGVPDPRRPQGRASEREPAAESGRIAVARPIGRARSRARLARCPVAGLGADRQGQRLDDRRRVAFYSLLAIFPDHGLRLAVRAGRRSGRGRAAAAAARTGDPERCAGPDRRPAALGRLGRRRPARAQRRERDPVGAVERRGGRAFTDDGAQHLLSGGRKASFVRFTWWRSPSRSA